MIFKYIFVALIIASGTAQAGGPVNFDNLQTWFEKGTSSFGTPTLPKITSDLSCQYASSKSPTQIQNGVLIAKPLPYFIPTGATYDKDTLMGYAKSQAGVWEIQTLIS